MSRLTVAACLALVEMGLPQEGERCLVCHNLLGQWVPIPPGLQTVDRNGMTLRVHWHPAFNVLAALDWLETAHGYEWGRNGGRRGPGASGAWTLRTWNGLEGLEFIGSFADPSALVLAAAEHYQSRQPAAAKGAG